MSDLKISQFASYTTPLDADVIPVVDTLNTTTKKTTWANIKLGIVKAATAGEITAGTASPVGGALLAVTPDALASSTPVFNASSLRLVPPPTTVKLSTSFETSARFTSTITGGGGQAVNTFNTNGVAILRAGTYAASSNNLTYEVTGKASTLYTGSPVFSCRLTASTISQTVSSSYFGLGNPTVATAGHTYTVGHAGFKIISVGSVYSLYATQADGTTETASSVLTTLAVGDDLDLILKVNSTTSVDYYWRKNGGTLSAATNLTTNMPSGTSQTLQFSHSTESTDTGTLIYTLKGASYER